MAMSSADLHMLCMPKTEILYMSCLRLLPQWLGACQVGTSTVAMHARVSMPKGMFRLDFGWAFSVGILGWTPW